MYPTRHAVQRYQERVAPLSTAAAFGRLSDLAATAKVRPTPRWWTPVKPAPGLAFAYPAAEPGVCLLLRDGVILTVLERDQCRAWSMRDAEAQPTAGRRTQRPAPYRRTPVGPRHLEAA